MTVTRRSRGWPPPCGMPNCDEPALPNSGRKVDFGAAGLRDVPRLCEHHLESTQP